MTYRDLYDKCKTVEGLKEDYNKFIDDYGLLCNDFVSVCEENDKLKAEIEQLKAELETYYKLYLASIDARELLNECVEQLKVELEHCKSEVIKKQLL